MLRDGGPTAGVAALDRVLLNSGVNKTFGVSLRCRALSLFGAPLLTWVGAGVFAVTARGSTL